MGFNCLKAIEPPQGYGSPFTSKSPEVLGIYLIDLGGMKRLTEVLAL